MSSGTRFYLVERYTPAVTAVTVEAAARRLTEASDGAARHVGTLLVAAEEICLSVFEAADEHAVVAMTERTGLQIDRIVEVEWFAAASHP